MRVLHFDIETAPMSGHFWTPKTEYIQPGMTNTPSFMLTWAAKWWRETKMFSDQLDPAHIEARDDGPVVESLAALIREADVVVGHNARRFDVRYLNTRLLLRKAEPLTPVRVVDTLELCRKSFDLPYNRLDYVAQALLGEGKIETSFGLWRGVMDGDEKAMRRMVRYNRKDVDLLERVFERIFPYAKGLPRLVRAAYDGEFRCPHCGSYDLQSRGSHDSNAQGWKTWQCNGCSRYSRERRASEPKLALVPIP